MTTCRRTPVKPGPPPKTNASPPALDCRLPVGEWTPADVAAELAVPEARVRVWMAAGLLVAPNGLTDGALHRFLCEHRAAWQAHCPPPSLWIASLLRDPDMRHNHRGCARRWHAATRDRAAAKAQKSAPIRKPRAWSLVGFDCAALAWKDAA